MIDPKRRGSDPEAPHLFPSRIIGAHSVSVQADRSGYRCQPRIRSDSIDDYDEVEVTIWGAEGRINPRKVAGFPACFLEMFDRDGVAGNVSPEAVESVEGYLRLIQSGPPLVETSDDKAVGFSDAEVLGLIAGINDAMFAGQWTSDDAARDAARKLLDAARARGLDLDPYLEALDLEKVPSPSP